MNIYLKAIKIIKERGWTTGRLESPDGSVCLIGSIAAATGSSAQLGFMAFPPKISNQLRQLINKREHTFGTRGIATWNDKQTSAEPVIDLLSDLADIYPESTVREQ